MLNALDAIIAQRYWPWASCAILFVASIALAPVSLWWLAPGAVFGGLTYLGFVDYALRRQSICRNYPVIAHFRFLFELIRPEIRQYFIEADSDELPYSRAQRSII